MALPRAFGAAARGTGLRDAALLIACLALAACAEPLEFADWTLEVPEGTRVVEFADVPDEEREGTIELRVDLALGEDTENPDEAFYFYPQPKVAADGRIFVLDGEANRVQVFGPDGAYERTLGGAGQGPEELFRPTSLAVTPRVVVVNDGGNARYNVWLLDGTHEGTPRPLTPGELGRPSEFHSLGDETFVGRHAVYGTDGQRGHLVARFSLSQSADEGFAYAQRWELLSLASRDGSRRTGVISALLTYAVGAASGSQALPVKAGGPAAVYVSSRDQYQVIKYGPDDRLEWALRVARSPEPYPEDDIEARLERLRARNPDVTRSEFDWPAALPALADMATDGAGRLYVFPYVWAPTGSPVPERRPVDVYTPEGERIFTGWMRGLGRYVWSDALGEHLYANDVHPETEEWRIVRYRLITPFE